MHRDDSAPAATVAPPHGDADDPLGAVHGIFAEFGPVEIAQLAAWAMSALISIAIILKRRGAREKMFAVWLGLVSILAAMREIDAHTLLNPERLGDWGVRYRLDWWLGAGPVLPRLLWASVAALVTIGLILPILKAAPRLALLLKGRDRAFWIFAGAGAALFLGYVSDDWIGRGRFVPTVYTRALEETLELAGAGAFFIAMIDLLKLPLTTRERFADEHLHSASSPA